MTGRRIRRWLLVAALALGAVAVVLGAGGAWLLRSDSGRAVLASLIADAASTPGELEIAIGRLDGALPEEILLADVTIADRDGIWLRLDTARIDWRPWALLDRRLAIRSLAARGLTIDRAPVSDPAPQPATLLPRDIALPALPLDVRLAAFDIDDVVLGEALFGEAASLRATGRFGADASGDARGKATIERTDGAALTATLEAVLEAPSQTLDIDLNVAEPQGGLIARLADLPDLPAVSLSLNGRGPASAWQGQLAARAQGLAALDADVALGLGKRLTIGVAGSADVESLLDGDALRLIGAKPHFDIRLALDDGGVLQIDRVLLTGQAVEATVTGTLDTANQNVDLEADMTVLDPDAVASLAGDLAFASATAHVAARGAPDDLTLAARAEISGLAAGGLTVDLFEAGLDGVLKPDQFSGRMTANLVGLAGDDPAFAALPPRISAAGGLTYDLAAEQVTLSGLTLDGPVEGGGIGVTANGHVDLASGDLDLDATASLAQLAPFAALAGIDLSGRASASLTLSGQGFGESGAGSLEVQLSDLASADLPLAPTVGRSATLQATIAAASTAGIDVSKFTLTGDNLSAGGRLALRDDWQTIDLAATLDKHALAPWRDVAGVALAGKLDVDAQVQGALADPEARAKLTLNSVSVEDVGPFGGAVTLTAKQLASAPAGTMSAKLNSPAGPVAASTRFARLSPDRLKLDAISLRVAGAQLDGALAINPGTGLATGALDLAADDLTALGDLAGMTLQGGAKGRLTLAATGGDQTGSLALSVPELSLPQPDGETISITALDLAATLKGLSPQPSGSATLTVGRVAAGTQVVKDVVLNASGSTTRMDFDVKAAATLPAEVDLAAAGWLASRAGPPGGWDITLDRLKGDAAGYPVALQGATTATIAGDTIAVTPFTLNLGQGRVSGRAALDARRVAAQLDIADLPLSMIAALAADSPQLGGSLSLQAALNGAATAPDGTLDLQLKDVSARNVATADSVALQGTVQAKLTAGRLAVHGDVGGFAEQGIVLDGEVPLRLSMQPFAASLPPNGAISGSLDWNGQVSTLWEALPFDTHRLAGIVDLTARAAGTVADPSVTASLKLTDGHYENLELGTVLDAIAVNAAADSGKDLTVSLSATDGGSGTISGNGNVALEALKNFPVDFGLDFSDAYLVRRDEIALSANGDLKLGGDLTALALSGTIETTRIEARIDSGMPPSVVVLGVVDSAAAAREEAEAEAKKSASALTLDLNISVPGQAFVRGRGLDSEWRGNLRVTGDAAEPAIAGTLSFVRGQFNFAGKRFSLAGSTITFDGSTKIDPLLDIRASYEATDVTAVILISGRSSNPRINLSSTPSLPTDEVLSRVLFGKSAGALSPVEGVQLAAAVAQLSGQALSGDGVLDKIRDSLGVDVLEVGAGENGNAASLRAGRYINDRTFVGVTQGTQPGSTGVTVEITVLPNIIVDSQVDQAGEAKTGVKWKWDY